MINNFFEVIRPGINTTFQDKGRFHMQHFGIAPAGCMDTESFLIANALVKNSSKEGVLEFAYQGPLLHLKNGKTKIAVTGGSGFLGSHVADALSNAGYQVIIFDQI